MTSRRYVLARSLRNLIAEQLGSILKLRIFLRCFRSCQNAKSWEMSVLSTYIILIQRFSRKSHRSNQSSQSTSWIPKKGNRSWSWKEISITRTSQVTSQMAVESLWIRHTINILQQRLLIGCLRWMSKTSSVLHHSSRTLPNVAIVPYSTLTLEPSQSLFQSAQTILVKVAKTRDYLS